MQLQEYRLNLKIIFNFKREKQKCHKRRSRLTCLFSHFARENLKKEKDRESAKSKSFKTNNVSKAKTKLKNKKDIVKSNYVRVEMCD